MSNLITFDHVVKDFSTKSGKVHVLKDVSFSIPQGSFTILFGPSGSGKSTILNTILGLEPPTSGVVSIREIDLYALNSDERAKFRTHSVGMVTQDNYWVNSLSVLDNVALPLYLCGYPRLQARKLARRSVKRIQLEKHLDAYPTVLSGGEQQRISVARATVKDPQIIVADEPTGNLDTQNGQEVLKLLLTYTKGERSTVVMVTHNSEFLQYADNIIHIKDGIVNQEQIEEGSRD